MIMKTHIKNSLIENKVDSAIPITDQFLKLPNEIQKRKLHA